MATPIHENGSRSAPRSFGRNERYIASSSRASNQSQNGTRAEAVQLNGNRVPTDLIGGSHHFADCNHNRRPVVEVPKNIKTSMNHMRRMIAEQELYRSHVNKYRKKKKNTI